MGPFILILLTLALLIGFLVLTWYEEGQGRRLCMGEARTRLDERVTRVSYILSHVDLPAFVRDEVRRAVKHVGHMLVALSLTLVRMLERLLTRLIRYLRSKYPVDTEPAADTRAFVKTLSAFKDRLKNTKKSDFPPIE